MMNAGKISRTTKKDAKQSTNIRKNQKIEPTKGWGKKGGQSRGEWESFRANQKSKVGQFRVRGRSPEAKTCH